MIESDHASLVYSDHGRLVYACQEIDLRVETNEFLGILGPSGSGKSSLLYLLSGLKIPTSGDVRFQGRSIVRMNDSERSTLRLRQFGFVFQQPYLLGYLSALENVMVSQASASADAALAILEKLGLGSKVHRLPHELSGGERQRVCVARALFGHPSVIFADEPTAALDHKNGVAVVDLLNRNRGEGSLIMVTHDPTMLEGADRVVRLVDGHLE